MWSWIVAQIPTDRRDTSHVNFPSPTMTVLSTDAPIHKVLPRFIHCAKNWIKVNLGKGTPKYTIQWLPNNVVFAREVWAWKETNDQINWSNKFNVFCSQKCEFILHFWTYIEININFWNPDFPNNFWHQIPSLTFLNLNNIRFVFYKREIPIL